MTTGQQHDLNNGLTMEVPYKHLGSAAILWSLIRRNMTVGISRVNTKFDANGAAEVQAKLINAVNSFTARPAFDARGLVADSQVPSDAVYEQWTKSLRFYLTLINKKPGIIEVSFGVQSRDPWKGIMIESIAEVYVGFYLRDGKYNIRPFGDISKTDEILGSDPFINVDIKPFHAWFHGSNPASGEIPSLINKATLLEQVQAYEEELRKKIDGIGGDANISVFGLKEQIERFDAWSGGGLLVKDVSIYSRLVPISDTLSEIHTCMSARGDYEMNFYARILKV